MKKVIILISMLTVAFAGIAFAINSQKSSLEDAVITEGIRCAQCKGTGFNGNYNCFTCKGTGRYGKY